MARGDALERGALLAHGMQARPDGQRGQQRQQHDGADGQARVRDLAQFH
jgi:hypothetical protein